MADRCYASPLDAFEDCLRALERVHPKDREHIVRALDGMRAGYPESVLDWLCRGGPPGKAPKKRDVTKRAKESDG